MRNRMNATRRSAAGSWYSGRIGLLIILRSRQARRVGGGLPGSHERLPMTSLPTAPHARHTRGTYTSRPLCGTSIAPGSPLQRGHGPGLAGFFMRAPAMHKRERTRFVVRLLYHLLDAPPLDPLLARP